VKISESNKKLAKTVAGVFGGTPQVFRYWDEKKASAVDILSCENVPQPGVTSHATIGLSDHSLGDNGSTPGLRTEFVAAFGSAFEEGANILSTAAFCVINSKWKIGPGVIYPEIISMYRKKSAMKHVLFSPPFLWDTLKTQRLSDKTVAWLMLVPVSEKEFQFAESNGSDALEDLFESKQIDIFNLDRPSIL
jgi:hypothetical protein